MFIQPGGNKFKVLALSLSKETMGRFKLRSNMLPLIGDLIGREIVQ